MLWNIKKVQSNGAWACLGPATAVLAALLAGCVNQQKEVAHYDRLLHAHPAASAAQLAVGHTLTLSKALAMANSNNEGLAIGGEDYLQSLIAHDRAYATFMPTVGIAPQDFQRKGFNETGFPGLGNVFQTHYFDVPLQAQLNVNVLRDARAIQAAGAYASQQKALLLDMQSNLLLEVAQTYYQVLSDQRSVKVLRRTLGVEQANVASMTRKEKAGVALRLSVYQSQADEASTRVELTRSLENVNNGRATLAYLIGVPSLAGAVLVNRFNPPKTIPSLASLDHIALAQRQDLKAAAAAELVAKKGVSAAVAEYFPTISANFNTFLYKESFPSDSWWSGLFSANFPIFEGGMIYQDIRKSYSVLRQAALRRQMLARKVLEEVRIARQNWITSNSLVRNLHTEWRSAAAAYAQARHSFGAGLATNLDVITAQDRALSARLGYEQARYAQRVNMLNLLRVTGRLTWPAVHELAAAEAVAKH